MSRISTSRQPKSVRGPAYQTRGWTRRIAGGPSSGQEKKHGWCHGTNDSRRSNRRVGPITAWTFNRPDRTEADQAAAAG